MNLVKRKVTYRLYPTAKQADGMFDMLRLHQQLYNACLEQRISAYKKSKKSLNYYDQTKELTLLRAELPEYKGLNAQSAQVTLKRLDLAYHNFFRRIKQGEAKAGFPRFKAYDRYSGWGYKTHGDGWRLHAGEGMKNGHLRMSGIGNLKIRGRARSIGTPKTMEIQRKQDKWYASVTVDCQPKRSKGARAIGIDWGLETYATLVDSDGLAESIENPRFVRKSLKFLKLKQQQLSKKKKGSKPRNSTS